MQESYNVKFYDHIRNGDFVRAAADGRFIGEDEAEARTTFLRAAFDDARCAVYLGIPLSVSLRLVRPLLDLREVAVGGSSSFT